MSDMHLSIVTTVPATLLEPTRLPEMWEDWLPPGQLVVLVTGSRRFTNRLIVWDTLDQFPVKFLTEGGAPGADRFAKAWAISRGIPHSTHEADWERHGRSAGPRRNRAMYIQEEPDVVLAFKDGFGQSSGGTEDMVSVARRGGTAVWLVDGGVGRWLV